MSVILQWRSFFVKNKKDSFVSTALHPTAYYGQHLVNADTARQSLG